MTRFFWRLAVAALADWICWKMSTPRMRLRRLAERDMRRITGVITISLPMVEGFGLHIERMAVGFKRLSEEPWLTQEIRLTGGKEGE